MTKDLSKAHSSGALPIMSSRGFALMRRVKGMHFVVMRRAVRIANNFMKDAPLLNSSN